MLQGIGKSIGLTLDATIDGVRWDDVHRIDLAPLNVYLIDAFEENHLLKVRSGNHLFPGKAIVNGGTEHQYGRSRKKCHVLQKQLSNRQVKRKD